MKSLWPNLKMFLWLSFLTGIVYPLLITAFAQLTKKQQADGNFLSVEGKVVGASLIAQNFTNPKYFWPRPSAHDYNALASGGSNLGPTSAALKDTVKQRQAALAKSQDISDPHAIPSELLYASGSGLDPHISPAAAQFQSARIAKARGLDDEKGKAALAALIDKKTQPRQLGFLGRPYINVLEINIALDELVAKMKAE